MCAHRRGWSDRPYCSVGWNSISHTGGVILVGSYWWGHTGMGALHGILHL